VGIFFAAQSLPYFLQPEWILLRTKHHEEQGKKTNQAQRHQILFIETVDQKLS